MEKIVAIGDGKMAMGPERPRSSERKSFNIFKQPSTGELPVETVVWVAETHTR